ncbi:MAG TPA: cysteine desulfurase [Methanoregulaceae archaeon]|nr:cysteine desulfurase [Methanoregulaceae archaeon]
MEPADAREDFPILKDIIYLDSASTSLCPVQVVRAVDEYELQYRANVGRGVHRLAVVATQKYQDAHDKVAGMIGGRQGTTVFTRNTTEAINMVALGMDFSPGDRIVTTLLEHHSNLLPWFRLKNQGRIGLDTIPPEKDGTLEISRFFDAIDENTRLVAVSQASNVLGTVVPVKKIAGLCKKYGARLLVDGAQSVPHMPVNVADIGCDYFCFSGHKMLGPSGTGVLWMKEPDLSPMLVGGGMVAEIKADHYREQPGFLGYEAGTPAIGAGIGLGRAVDYLQSIGMARVQAHENSLTGRMIRGLSGIGGVDVYGPMATDQRIGVVSFTIAGMHPHDVAHILDEASGIMVRSGEHCCSPLMRHLGATEGTVRASLHLYNNGEDVEHLLTTVEEISRMT